MHTENEPSPSDNVGLASACGNGFTASHFANGRFHPADARPLYNNQYFFRCSTLECLSLKQRPDDEVIVVWAFSKLLDFAIQLVVVRSVTRPKVGAGQTAFPDAILLLLPGSPSQIEEISSRLVLHGGGLRCGARSSACTRILPFSSIRSHLVTRCLFLDFSLFMFLLSAA